MPSRARSGPERRTTFDWDTAFARLREAVRPYPDAAMFELAERGYGTLFQQLVACILSIRTRDETSLPLAIRLFERAPTPASIARLAEEEIATLIAESTFAGAKARQIRLIAERTAAEYGDDLPADEAALTSFHGVGPKCAHLALGVARGVPVIAVDVHVHRVTNRWGILATRTPEGTMDALQEILPERYRVEINRRLVPFGKHVCTGVRPKCSTCPLLDMCAQVGVTSHR